MHAEGRKPGWSRRAFLTRAGGGGLAVASFAALKALPRAEAGGKKAKFVVTWNAFDTI